MLGEKKKYCDEFPVHGQEPRIKVETRSLGPFSKHCSSNRITFSVFAYLTSYVPAFAVSELFPLATFLLCNWRKRRLKYFHSFMTEQQHP